MKNPQGGILLAIVDLLLLLSAGHDAEARQTTCMKVLTRHRDVRIHCVNPPTVPQNLPNVTKELTFTCDAKHGLNSLTAEALKHLPRLEHIVLRGCPIESIDEDAFRGMTNLESVTIEDAPIEELKSGLFGPGEGTVELRRLIIINCPALHSLGGANLLRGQSHFHELTLVNTAVHDLDDLADVIAPVAPSLKELTVRNSSLPLRGGSGDPGGRMLNLHRVDLSYNKLENLDILHNMRVDDLNLASVRFSTRGPWYQFPESLRTSLVRLDLSNLTFIPPDLLPSQVFPRLTELIIRGSFINRFPGALLSLTPNLLQLDLRDNKITTLSQQSGDRFDLEGLDLRLGGNPIHCNCEMAWLSRSRTMAHMVPCFTTASETGQSDEHGGLRSYANRFGEHESPVCLKPTKPLIKTTDDEILPHDKQFAYKRTTAGEPQLEVECHSLGDPPPRIVWFDNNLGEVVAEQSISAWQRGPRTPTKPATLTIDEQFVIDRQHNQQLDLSCLAENTEGFEGARLKVVLRGYLGEVAMQQRPPKAEALIGARGGGAIMTTTVTTMITALLWVIC